MGKNYDKYVSSINDYERARLDRAEVEGGGTREAFERTADNLQDTYVDMRDAEDTYLRDPEL